MQENNRENSKIIVKNTLLLYVRMIFTMLVSLFTSRVILNTLGIEDYGIYNVVGGTVAMFSFFTSSLSAAISRFLTFELGINNKDKLNLIFSSSINILLGGAVVILVLIEFVGNWFLNTKLNIPIERISAANWVMQCSIIIFVVNLISVPYIAAIISHEKMSAFAYISILETVLKLVVAYSLYISCFDKLITYVVLLVVVSLIIRIVYGIYCNCHFEECKYRWVLNRALLKEMGSFAGWNMMGSAVYLFNTQGVNIVSNMFFGVSINAARGVATQVDSVMKQFVANFTTAINPQITKSYAVGNMEYMFMLVCRGAKYSYFLMFLFVVPFMYETDIILKLWLHNVPEYTAIFLRLTMWGTLFDILGNAIANAVWATGKVKRYYKYVATVGSLVFPFSWVAFACGMPPSAAYVIFMIVYLAVVFVKLYILEALLGFPMVVFFRKVFLRILPVSLLSFVLPGVCYYIMEESLIRLLLLSLVSVLSTCACFYYIGMEQTEKQMITNKIHSIIRKK